MHADIHSITFKPGSTSTAVISSDGGVHYTGSMGSAGFSAVIEDRNLGYNTIQFYYGAIGSNPATDDLLGGTQDNGTPVRFSALSGEGSYIERYTGDGAYTEIDVEDGYIIQSYTFNDHNIDISPYNFSDYQVSNYDSNNPKGQFINVGELDSNLDILYYDISDSAFEIESASNLLGGSSASIVYQTLSNVVMNQQPSAMKVSPHTSASTTLLVGLKNGRVIKITGANTVTPSWSNLTASVGGSFLGSVSDVEFGANEDEIYVTLYNYGIDNVWYTDDGGATWQNKEGDLPDIPVRSILRNPLRPQEVIIGTQIGVWATSDFTQANPTWVQTNNGMSEVAVVDLDLRAADNVILASTHGRGQFTSQFTSQALALDEANIVASNIKLVPSVTRDGAFGLLASQSYGTTSVKIFNMSGQQLYATDIELSRQRSTIQTNLSTGMYLVVLEHPDFRGTKRLIVQ